jgi:hypothetical protein
MCEDKCLSHFGLVIEVKEKNKKFYCSLTRYVELFLIFKQDIQSLIHQLRNPSVLKCHMCQQSSDI